MQLQFRTLKALTAAMISLWMAVLACFVGCTLPVFANSDFIHASSAQENTVGQGKSEPMEEMENCPHHSGGSAPKTQNDGTPPPSNHTSCCPLEVTVASRIKTESLSVAPTRDFVLSSDLSLRTVRFYDSFELVQPILRSGRDTLLKTHLLRI